MHKVVSGSGVRGGNPRNYIRERLFKLFDGNGATRSIFARNLAVADRQAKERFGSEAWAEGPVE
jgi:hypothetical protein